METFILDNGLRVVTDSSATDVVYCGIAIDAGTRDELVGEEGIAHFTEHLTFKGTHRRKSWHILNRMESVGGDLNAFTGKEETVYYCTFLKEHFARAIDLLLDIVFNSTYPQHEMDKEVEVVIDEIESYCDSPSELIYDDFENLLFNGHSLGHNILGDAEGLRKMKSEDIIRFVQRLYRPDRMVLFVKGNIPSKTVLRLVQKSKNVGRHVEPNVTERLAPPSYMPQNIVMEKGTHQAHVMMGTRSFGANDHRHLHLSFLNNILGGPSMNSRLNLALRERNGLVYTVESNSVCYSDVGVWSVYFGCDKDDVKRCQNLVLKELKRLTDRPLTERELMAAKRQMIGQICVSYDSFENVAIGMGKRFLHYNRVQTCEDLCCRIDALTAEELHQTACELFVPEKMTTLVYK
ncbi:MAG: insulinase family protein [Bacteroidaceae bacterium]|nr:insulinase family protein [Bacteroidaceae bacterium]